MRRRWQIGLIVVALGAGAIVFAATRGDDAGKPIAAAEDEAPERGGKAKSHHSDPDASSGGNSSNDPGAGKNDRGDDAEGGGDPSKAELRASRRIQNRVGVNALAAQNALKTFGLPGRIGIRDEGRVVVVRIPRSKACEGIPEDEERIRALVLKAQPSVRKVVVEVAGTGQSLSAYVAANCDVPELPSGPGSTEFERTGDGFTTTDPFTVTGPKWSIDYQADGASLFVFVLKGDDVIDPAIAQQGRGTGTQTYKGGGRYRLEIRGSGYWTVRVRNGA